MTDERSIGDVFEESVEGGGGEGLEGVGKGGLKDGVEC